MIPAGAGRHRDHFAMPELSRSHCTSSRVTWGGGDCLDLSGELVKGCPRHQPNTYVQTAAHRASTRQEGARVVLDRWATARPSGASWRQLLDRAGLTLEPWQEATALHYLTTREDSLD